MIVPPDLLKPAPKELIANLEYRELWAEFTANNPEAQEWAYIRCARDIVFFTDTFGWTFAPVAFPDQPYRPFVLWPYQEIALANLCGSIGVRDVIIDKSRDAGASWLCLLAFMWRWQFRAGQSLLLVSRTENYVDKKNEPDSLFWKCDMLLERQPKWLLPRFERNNMSLANLDNGSTITGASTTGDVGRGGRKTAILLDEFAAVQDGYSMLSATRDATRTRIINSTRKGAAGAYADQLAKMQRTSPDGVITMDWSDHPLKYPGAYRVTDGKLEIVDSEWHHEHPGYKFVKDGPFFWNGELRSPWFDNECNRAASPREIAQEICRKAAESESQYFDAGVLARLRENCSRQPYHRGEVIWDDGDWTTGRWDENPKGRVRLWFNPDAAGKVPWTDIVIGCDVATGKGGDMSSNSVASAVRSSTGEKILEFPVNTLNAHEFCEYVMAMCHWMNHAFLIWEDAGPGGEFTRRLRDGAYGNVYRRDSDENTFGRKKTRKLGFAPTAKSKQTMLADYRTALATGKFINHSDEALIECGEYIVLPTSAIEHSRAVASIDPNARGRNHGDRVIADALAWKAIKDRGGDPSRPVEPPKRELPLNCAAARRQERERKLKVSEIWD